MNEFRDRLKCYKNGTAAPEEAESLRLEIEKHEAISDFLAEEFNEQLPPMEETDDTLSAKRISRKASLRLFLTVLLTVLSMAILTVALIGGCNLYFYNPNKGIQPTYGGDGQLLVDMIAFTELHSPGYSTYWAKAWRDGPGSYQVRIRQQNVFLGESENYSEQVVRGKALGNDREMPNDYWHFPLMDAFGERQGIVASYEGETGERIFPSEKDWSEDLQALAQLPDSCRAAVYVTFSKDLTLEQFSNLYKKWTGKLDFLYAAVVSDDKYMASTIGFAPDSAGTILEKNIPDEKEYPYFQLFQASDAEANQATLWAKHFDSLLRYMSGRGEFLNTMASVNGIGDDYYREVLSYVNENGVKIYGVLLTGNVKSVQAFLAQESYSDFYVSGVRLSAFSD
ncbi:sigma factor regulator [Ruminiclostridium sufflavum DSM 19573]|uniref:Sigma factor regulator n=1 Tax=Ruminiclostridium sufflavum DSM 19573 TaxID=1121337 RepID=A0A318Y4P8_9FIRM|nr:anti sigma factor C-terminal domain-containing protein [Ruminiclostridium sufflavum]PYG87001.1 sigma factor regulator [Ruminiclostridium sufflavum DSM 19573]